MHATKALAEDITPLYVHMQHFLLITSKISNIIHLLLQLWWQHSVHSSYLSVQFVSITDSPKLKDAHI